MSIVNAFTMSHVLLLLRVILMNVSFIAIFVSLLRVILFLLILSFYVIICLFVSLSGESMILVEEDISFELLSNGVLSLMEMQVHENLSVLLKANMGYVSKWYMSGDSFVFKVVFTDNRLIIDGATANIYTHRYVYPYGDPIGFEVRRCCD